LEIDHLCRNRSCVNPKHLEVVTRGENVRRGKVSALRSLKEHCPKGHAYEKDGNRLYYNRKSINGRNQYRCRVCHLAYNNAYNARRRKQKEEVSFGD
jgi:transposase-like protein